MSINIVGKRGGNDLHSISPGLKLVVTVNVEGFEQIAFFGGISEEGVVKLGRALHIVGEVTCRQNESRVGIVGTLEDLLSHLGDRKCAVVREMTKLYEEVLRGNISDMIAHFDETDPKGEFVIVVEGYDAKGSRSASDDEPEEDE